MPRPRFHFLLFLIVAFGAYLRFAGLGVPSLWLDEILHVYRATEAQAQPWLSWLTGFHFEVENGPLFYASQLAARPFAGGETAVRLAPAAFGTLSIAVLGLAGRAVGGSLTGLVAAALLAVSPYHVYFSREGRVYGLIMLMSCLLLLIFLRRRTAWTVPLGLGICVLAAYTGAVAGPLLGAAVGGATLLLANAFWQGRRRPLKTLLKASSLRRDGLLLVAALLGIALVALLYLGSPRYEPEPGEKRGETPNVTHALSRTALMRTVNGLCYSGLDTSRLQPRAALFLGLALLGLLAPWRHDRRATIVLTLFVIATLAASLAVLFYLNQWFLVRYISSAVPPFVLAVAVGAVAVSRWLGKQVQRMSASAGRLGEITTLVVLLAALGLPNLAAARSEPFQKADWRRMAGLLEDLVRPGDTVLVTNSWSEVCLSYYLRDAQRPIALHNARQETAQAQAIVAEAKAAWLVIGGYHGQTDIGSWVRSFHPIWTSPIETLGLYFYPDFQTFTTPRGGAAPCAYCYKTFTTDLETRLDADGRDGLLRGQGWFAPEQGPEGMSFQWINGQRAELALPVDRPAAATIRFRAMPLDYPQAPRQRVRLRLNGRQVGALAVKPGWQEYALTVAAQHWRPGLNLLVLELARADRPQDVLPGSGDPRFLGLALDYLQLDSHDERSAAPDDVSADEGAAKEGDGNAGDNAIEEPETGDVDAASARHGTAMAALMALPYAGWDRSARPDQLGVVAYDEKHAWAGFNLYTNDVNRAYLMDMAGRTVHTWALPRKLRHCEHAELLDDGALLVVCVGQGLVKLDWDSKLLWRNRLNVHHDVAVRADGTLLVPLSSPARLYQGRQVKFDRIAHLSAQGEVLSLWSTADHLEALQALHAPSHLDAPTPEDAAPEDAGTVFDYYHLNAVEALPSTPLAARDPRFRAGNVLISLRNANLIAILDQDSWEVVWYWGPGELSLPHMPTMLANGHLLIFDNGAERDHTRVIELDVLRGEIVWQYRGDPPQSFYSKWRGSNQRLPNGNTLICESEKGHVFEVTPAGEIVWDFWNPELKDDKRRRIYRFMRIPTERLRAILRHRRTAT